MSTGKVICPEVRLGRAADGTVWADSDLFRRITADDLGSLLSRVEQVLAQHGSAVPRYRLVGWVTHPGVKQRLETGVQEQPPPHPSRRRPGFGWRRLRRRGATVQSITKSR